MKYTEFHRLIVRNGWKFDCAEGSHYFYTKVVVDENGVEKVLRSTPVPFHGSKEIGEGLRNKIKKQMDLKQV